MTEKPKERDKHLTVIKDTLGRLRGKGEGQEETRRKRRMSSKTHQSVPSSATCRKKNDEFSNTQGCRVRTCDVPVSW